MHVQGGRSHQTSQRPGVDFGLSLVGRINEHAQKASVNSRNTNGILQVSFRQWSVL